MSLRPHVAIPRLVVSGILASSLFACGELAHTNPVDPEAEVTIGISGPLEIHSVGQLVSYTFTSVPEWTYSAPQWESSDPEVLALDAAGGLFLSKGSGDALVTVRLGPHTATALPVRVVQVAARLRVLTCDGKPADIGSTGLQIRICAFLHDSLDAPILDKPVSLVSDDTSIVAVHDGIAVGRSCGSTYVRADTASWRDSLLVRVCY